MSLFLYTCVLLCTPVSDCVQPSEWGGVDTEIKVPSVENTEIKVPSVENTELKGSPFNLGRARV